MTASTTEFRCDRRHWFGRSDEPDGSGEGETGSRRRIATDRVEFVAGGRLERGATRSSVRFASVVTNTETTYAVGSDDTNARVQ
ncbi:hypothetical protein A6E15_11455 [Natrinema saccharevitans]|uniref:Uncharacterized protein n=1 Tax=Natrinema saccharevitans TaxID=301967 RepID=A0A1S8AXQ3_9EURY|nr:hypothetical protein A6E15_11455 [Natrinema saccharevitans]